MLKVLGEYKLMMVFHDTLVAMQIWKNNNVLTWRDDSKYFRSEFEYSVKRRNIEKWIGFPNTELLFIDIMYN